MYFIKNLNFMSYVSKIIKKTIYLYFLSPENVNFMSFTYFSSKNHPKTHIFQNFFFSFSTSSISLETTVSGLKQTKFLNQTADDGER